jgi:pimeloyl-ACP methyl ester carboxylesterase
MHRMKRVFFAALIIGASCLASSAAAQTPGVTPGPCVPGVLSSRALSLICTPVEGWNGELIVFAHGYIPVTQELGFYNLTLPDGTLLPAVAQSLGYAFATTSYRQNGLAILEGVDDVRLLVDAFGPASKVHVIGVSEGGLVATLLAERSPDVFASAVAACAPVAGLKPQIDTFGDFRVLFDYFFPGTIPGSAVDVPPAVIATFFGVYVPKITAALNANRARALELMRVSKAPFDPANLDTIVQTTINRLFYQVFGTQDAAAKLGGNPFGNRFRLYFGSTNDFRLNLLVRRFTAAPAALAALHQYETTGDLRIPLVAPHTTGDEVVPFAHELIYLTRFDPSDRGRFLPLPIFRYSHCNFTTDELLGAFLLAVSRP